MDILNFKFKKIKNFFTESETSILKDYCKIKHMENRDSFDYSALSNNNDTFFYDDELMRVLMNKKKGMIEDILNIKLHSTYCYWRCYTNGAMLQPHTDRPSCEFSISAFIDSDKTKWPIYMEDTPVDLEAGDAVLYKGTDVKHGRKVFEGDYHIQVFFHYVDQNGPHKNHKGDIEIKKEAGMT